MTARDNPPTTNRIREVRLQRGMTLQELGEKAGMHYTTVAKLERSQRGLKLAYLSALAIALGVTPRDLLGAAPDILPMRMIPLIERASASAWSEAVDNPLGAVPSPAGGANAFAIRPDANSMDLVVGSGALVVVDPDDLELRDGKVYAMRNADAETVFKRFRSDPLRFERCSTVDTESPVPLGREPLTTIGRVVWQGSEL